MRASVEKMRTERRWFLTTAVALAWLVASSGLGSAQSTQTSMRWDIISVDFTTTPLTVSAGGSASATAIDGSMITMTGSGTFRTPGARSEPLLGFSIAKGGGIWSTFDNTGAPTGTGKYEVKSVVRFVVAPGTQGMITDTIGDGTLADNRAGLAVFRIKYDDGSHGFLVVSCHLGGSTPTPAAVFEGITATKDFVDYWRRSKPVRGVDGNRTLFHVLP